MDSGENSFVDAVERLDLQHGLGSSYPELPSSSPKGNASTPDHPSTQSNDDQSMCLDSFATYDPYAPDLDQLLSMAFGNNEYQDPESQFSQDPYTAPNGVDSTLIELDDNESPVAGPVNPGINTNASRSSQKGSQREVLVLEAQAYQLSSYPDGGAHTNDLAVQDEADFRRRQAQKPIAQSPVDSGFPTDAATQRVYVKRLFNAIKNVNDTDDTDRVVKAFQKGLYQDLDIEMVCWDLLFKARDSQERGRQCAAHAESRYEQYGSFHERIESVIRSCNLSKLFCKSLLAPSFTYRAVDQPHFEVARKASNKVLNQIKSQQNQAGKSAMQKGLLDDSWKWRGDNNDQSPDPWATQSNVSTPAPGTNHSDGSNLTSTGRKRTRAQTDTGGNQEPVTPTKRRSGKRNPKAAIEPQTPNHDNINDLAYVTPLRPSRTAARRSNSRQLSMTDPIPGYHPAESVSSAQFDGAGVNEVIDLMNSSPAEANALALLEERYKSCIAGLLKIPREVAATTDLFYLRWYARCCSEEYSMSYWSSTVLPPQHFGYRTHIHSPKGTYVGHVGDYIKELHHLAKARGDILPDGSSVTNSELINLTSGRSDLSGNLKRQVLGIDENLFGIFDMNDIRPHEQFVA